MNHRVTENFLPKIQRCLELSGFLPVKNRRDISFLFRRYALHAIRTLFVAQTALIPLSSWKTWDLELKIVWLEEFSCELPSFTYCLNFFYSRSHTETILRLAKPVLFNENENKDQSLGTTLSEEVSAVVKREDTRSLKLLESAEFYLNLVITCYALKPLFRIILHWVGVKSLDAAALPVMCYNPFVQPLTSDVTEVNHVFILSILQLIFLYDITMAAHATHEGLFLCIGNIVTDIKVLRLELGEMRMHLEKIMNQQLLTLDDDVADHWCHLRSMIRRVCYHHQSVFRKVREINKIFTFPILILNGYCCIYVCLGVYCMVKGELTAIITHCVPTLIIIFFCYIFCENGQRIETEGEDLQAALYDCYFGFRGVPLWYQKSILMLIRRHTRPPSLGPFRIFSLNRINFKVVIQGALSYFNILSNIAD